MREGSRAPFAQQERFLPGYSLARTRPGRPRSIPTGSARAEAPDMDTTVSDGQDLYWWSSQVSNTPYPGRAWSLDALSKHHAVTERVHAMASELRGVLNDVLAQVLALVPGPLRAASAAGVHDSVFVQVLALAPGPLLASSTTGVPCPLRAASAAGVPGPLIPSSAAGVLAAFAAGVPGPSPSTSIVPAAALTAKVNLLNVLAILVDNANTTFKYEFERGIAVGVGAYGAAYVFIGWSMMHIGISCTTKPPCLVCAVACLARSLVCALSLSIADSVLVFVYLMQGMNPRQYGNTRPTSRLYGLRSLATIPTPKKVKRPLTPMCVMNRGMLVAIC